MAVLLGKQPFWLQGFVAYLTFFACVDSRAMRTAKTLRPKAGEELRLPRDVLPRLYDISLLPLLVEGNFTTEGSVNVLIDCVKTTNKVTLHVADITVDFATVKVGVLPFYNKDYYDF